MPLSRRDALVSAGTLAGVGMIAGGAKATNASSRGTPSTEAVCLTDFEPLAKAKISEMAWEYVNGGAADEATVRWNREAFSRIRLKPRALVNVSKLDTRVLLFRAGPPISHPACGHRCTQADASGRRTCNRTRSGYGKRQFCTEFFFHD